MSRRYIGHYHLRPLVEYVNGKWEVGKHYAIDWYGGNGHYVGNFGRRLIDDKGTFVNLTHKEALVKIRKLRG